MQKGKGWLLAILGLCMLAQSVRAGEGAPTANEMTEPIDDLEYGESLEPQRIVVTATRIPTPETHIPNSISVVTAEKMEERQYRSVVDALKTVPGVSMNRSGGMGGLTHIYMRGLDSGRTVLLMDGMPLNDPSTPGGDFDFSMMTLDNIAQLEVLRGPQSSLYGSGASGGVINLSSKRGEGPFSGFASAEGGSKGTVTTRLGSSAGTDKVDFSFAGSFTHTDGISAFDKKYGNSEKDRYEQGNFSLRLGANPTDMLRLDLFANVQKAEFEFDDGPQDLWNGDNENLKQKYERFMIRPQATLSLLDGRWEQSVGFGYMRNKRRYKDEPYAGNADWYVPGYYNVQRNKYLGETTKFDYKSIFRLHETNTLLAGMDVITDSLEYTHVAYKHGHEGTSTPNVTPAFDPGSATTVGLYVEDQINIDDTLFFTAGMRQEHHDDFGDKTTWKASAMYVLPTETKLKASAGTGFKAPTLYQLHVGYYGGNMWNVAPNSDLKAETSFGWDAGFEQSLCEDRLTLGATYFRNRVKNKIVEDYAVNRYVNIDKYRTWGIETFIEYAITDSLSLSGQYTWLRTEDARNRRAMYRRPLNEASVNVDWRILERGILSAGVKHVGRRLESYKYDTGTSGRMPSHTLVRVAASWKITDHIEVFGRVENLLDKKYQEVNGYGTEGITAFGGITLSF